MGQKSRSPKTMQPVSLTLAGRSWRGGAHIMNSTLLLACLCCLRGACSRPVQTAGDFHPAWVGESAADSGGRSLSADMHEACAWYESDPVVKNYTWMSDKATRHRAQVNPGNRERLRAAMERYKQGQKLHIAFLGGSITAGQGAVDGKAFPYWAEDALKGVLDEGRLSIQNGAVPGTLSSYMSVCHNVHMSKEADIVMVEYSVSATLTCAPACMRACMHATYLHAMQERASLVLPIAHARPQVIPCISCMLSVYNIVEVQTVRQSHVLVTTSTVSGGNFR